MKEKDIYQKMKRKAEKKEDLDIFLQRIESGATSCGIPDVYYYKTILRHGWIELKAIKMTPRKNVLEVPFQPGQFAWINNFLRYSDNVYLFLYVENKYIENTLSVFRGKNIALRYYYNVLDVEACYHQIWTRVDWDRLLDML